MRRLCFFLPLVLCTAAPAQSLKDVMFKTGAPKLTIFISIDQFRADYLTRFKDQFMPARAPAKIGGFRYLMETGAWFTNARYNHIPTETGPGHAVLGTGAPPYLSGIVSNNWRDPKTGNVIYCVEDQGVDQVGGKDPVPAGKRSPKNLMVSTYGDKLKRATGGKSINVSVAWKDRAAILMAGHLSSGVVWFDDRSGGWISSTFYGATLPSWAVSLDVNKDIGKRFDPGQPDTFPNSIKSPDDVKKIRFTPFSSQHTLEAAEAAIRDLGMGKDDIPDSLTISFSANDYVGHKYGPDSIEMRQITIWTDHILSELFNWIQSNLPGGLDGCLIALTGDHGVAPVTEDVKEFGVGRVPDVEKLVNDFLNTAFPDAGTWNAKFTEPWLYLESKPGIDPKAVEAVAVRVLKGSAAIFGSYTRTQFEENRLPQNEVGKALARSYRADRCGDILVVYNPWWQAPGSGDYQTNHGQPFPYDQCVPILLHGPGIQKGIYTERVCPEDIAPTICTILGISVPSGCQGNPIGIAKEH